MSLPGITEPEGTPFVLAEGHSIEEDSVYRDVRFGHGHGRKRRVRTAGDRVVAVSKFLKPAQLAAYDDWIEYTLVAASLEFAAQVASQDGETPLWWRARWVAPPTFEMLPLGRARVSGSLFLTGEGETEGPDTSTLSMRITAPLVAGAAFIRSPVALSMSITAPLQASLLLSMSITAALQKGASLKMTITAELLPEEI